MKREQYIDPFDWLKYFRVSRKIEPVKCECCGTTNTPQKDCPVCGGKGVKHIIIEN